MQLRTLLDSDEAVSPVIGVILMVAITVILAAVIGTFVLGFGDRVQHTAPNAHFSFDFNETSEAPIEAVDWNVTGTSSIDGNLQGVLTIEHRGGDNIPAPLLALSGPGELYDESETFAFAGGSHAPLSEDDRLSAGTSVAVALAEGEDNVRIVWTSVDGSTSSTIGQWNR